MSSRVRLAVVACFLLAVSLAGCASGPPRTGDFDLTATIENHSDCTRSVTFRALGADGELLDTVAGTVAAHDAWSIERSYPVADLAELEADVGAACDDGGLSASQGVHGDCVAGPMTWRVVHPLQGAAMDNNDGRPGSDLVCELWSLQVPGDGDA